VLLALDLVTTALVAESIRNYLVVNFGNPSAFLYMRKDMLVVYAITAVMTIASQLFYASRIYMVNKRNRIVPSIIAFLAVIAFGCAIAVDVETFENILVETLNSKKLRILGAFYSGFAAACDIMATISLCYYLASYQTDFTGTKALLSRIMFFTINRGVLVSIAQIGFGVSYQIGPSKGYWMPFHLALAKLHLNTLLAMLNSRATLRSRFSVNQENNTSKALSSFRAVVSFVSNSTPTQGEHTHVPTDKSRSSYDLSEMGHRETDVSTTDFSAEDKPVELVVDAEVSSVESA